MIPESRPLWKLLLDTADADGGLSLSCEECFLILEYLAEANNAGVERPRLIEAARRHLDACPDCQEFYQRRLDELASLEKTEGET